jgi:hypothetical protein
MKVARALGASLLVSTFLVAESVSPGPAFSSSGNQQAREVPVIFRPFYNGPILPDERLEAVRAALPYDTIALELSGGMVVPGGHFRLVFQRDGSAQLRNINPSLFGPAGNFVGTASYIDFGKLSHLISESGLENGPRSFRSTWSDMQTMTLTAVGKERSISIEDYGGAAPVQFWAVQQAMIAMGRYVRWSAQ